MTVGTLFLNSIQGLIILNVIISSVLHKISGKKEVGPYMGFSIIFLVVLLFIYFCMGIGYIFDNWDKVIF